MCPDCYAPPSINMPGTTVILNITAVFTSLLNPNVLYISIQSAGIQYGASNGQG